MTSFDEREKSFERRYQQDQEFAFKVKARRNRIAGRWAAALLGKTAAEADGYAAEIVASEFDKHGDEHLIAKLAADLAAKGVDRDRVIAELETAATQAKQELGAPR
jgi:hypothetical protein